MTTQSKPFAPENVYRGEDGRWYSDSDAGLVDVTYHPTWRRCRHGVEWQQTLGDRTAPEGSLGGCPECADCAAEREAAGQ